MVRRLLVAAAVTLAAAAKPAVAQHTHDPKQIEQLLSLGTAARKAGRPSEAIKRLEDLLKFQPENVDARLQLGLSLAARQRYDDAQRELTRVLEAAPDYDDARLGLARIAFWRRDLAEAERQLGLLRKTSRENTEAKALAEQITKARADARAKAEAEAERRRLDRARMLRWQGRPAEAEKIFRDALVRHPKDAALWVDLGLALALQNRFSEARIAYERALTLDPQQIDAQLGLARVDLQTHSLDDADRRVTEILAADPLHMDARAIKARIRLARGDPGGAEAEFRALAAQNSGASDFLVGLGDSLRAQYRDADARAAYEHARAVAPDSVEVSRRLALSLRPRWRLDLDGGYSRLDENLDPWREIRAGIGYVLDEKTTLSGGVEFNRRFGKTDVLIDARVDHRWSEEASTFVRLGGTPDADYRPEVLAEAGGAIKILPGGDIVGPTIATFELGYARYRAGGVKSASPGVLQYFANGRIWVTARLIATLSETDEALGGFLTRIDWVVIDSWKIFAGYSDAPESSGGLTVETRTLFGGVAIDLDRNTTLNLSASREDRSKSSERTTFNVGITSHF